MIIMIVILIIVIIIIIIIMILIIIIVIIMITGPSRNKIFVNKISSKIINLKFFRGCKIK